MDLSTRRFVQKGVKVSVGDVVIFDHFHYCPGCKDKIYGTQTGRVCELDGRRWEVCSGCAVELMRVGVRQPSPYRRKLLGLEAERRSFRARGC